MVTRGAPHHAAKCGASSSQRAARSSSLRRNACVRGTGGAVQPESGLPNTEKMNTARYRSRSDHKAEMLFLRIANKNEPCPVQKSLERLLWGAANVVVNELHTIWSGRHLVLLTRSS